MSGLLNNRYPVIIPSAVDDAGIYPDIFREGNFNLLPLAHKSLIQYLVDDLRKDEFCDRIGDIYVVVDEELESCYNRQLCERSGITVISEELQRRRGVLASVNRAREQLTDKDRNKPFLIFYGDTLVQDLVLEELLKVADELHERELEGGEKDWCVVVFIRDQEMQLAKHYEKNRWGHIVINRNLQEICKGDDSDDKPPIWHLSTEDIRDVLYRPTYPNLLENYLTRRYEADPAPQVTDGKWKDQNELLLESGVLIFSASLWDKFTQHQEERDPLGMKSIPFSARRLLVDKQFTVKGVVTNADAWIDVNYPWEYLQANEYLCRRLARQMPSHLTSSLVGRDDHVPRDLEDSDFIIVSSTKQLKALLDPEIANAPTSNSETAPRMRTSNRAHRFTNEYDSRENWGICDSVVINGTLVLPNPAKVRDLRLYIGGNVTIEGHCVIRNGTQIRANAMLNTVNIGANCLIDCHCNIDHSVIMDSAKVLSGAAVTYSVVGRGAVIGGRSTIACEKLIAIGEDSEIIEPCGDAVEAVPELIDFSDPYDQMSKYHASTTIVRHNNRFGALIGDSVKIGANSLVQPGRKVGMHSVVTPGTEIRRNIPPGSEVTPADSSINSRS
ncbi:NTP transferase domain-containing protein [bacterium]|nr:NTP transferase domain-containing protein [bacterium]